MMSTKSLNPYSNYVNKEKEQQPEPKYHCASCDKCTNSICSTYNRYVEPHYNRCFNHSHYNPIKATFKAPINLLEIINQEQTIIA